ncbi:MAG: transcriptional regulator NrdR [Oscillospiraceae bacterium]|jgi:transcriptional repressor NrdR|nr:transcriptional regulator NrdR [Oscillospiraceae bacterium]
MKCPSCGHNDSRVVDSRTFGEQIRRRRECLNPECHIRFTTFETYEESPLLVEKKDHSLEPFSRAKLMDKLLRATAKRPVSLELVQKAVKDIENDLRGEFRRNVTSEMIGRLTLQKLLKIDKVAYIRFASVYREFNDVDSFISEITTLKENEQTAESVQPTIKRNKK